MDRVWLIIDNALLNADTIFMHVLIFEHFNIVFKINKWNVVEQKKKNKEKFEVQDTKRVIRSRISKDIQYTGQKKKTNT
jgi:hypothetical protein